jgi:hypothetical protein
MQIGSLRAATGLLGQQMNPVLPGNNLILTNTGLRIFLEYCNLIAEEMSTLSKNSA